MEPVEQPLVRGRAVVLATSVLVATVAALSALSLLALDRISASSDTITVSSRVLASYQSLQRSIASEAFAEAGYRRAPSPAGRARLLASFARVDEAAGALKTVGSAADRGTAQYLEVLNARYAQQVREALTEGGPAAIGADDRVAGPALDAMESLVDAAIRRTSVESQHALAHERRLTRQLRWLVPVVLTGAVGGLALAWSLVLRQHRKATTLALASERLALHDPLTGAGNRRAFERALAPELRRESPDATVVLLDLDGFKEVNDTYGHDAGDAVLRAVAERLRSVVRPDDVVARMGGDEFALLVRPREAADALIDRVRTAVGAPLEWGAAVLRPGVSVGRADVVAGTSQEEVLRAADRELYVCKRRSDRRSRGNVPFAG